MYNQGPKSDTIVGGVQLLGGRTGTKFISGGEYYRGLQQKKHLVNMLPIATFIDKQAQLFSTERDPREPVRYPVDKFYNFHTELSKKLKTLINPNIPNEFTRDVYDNTANMITGYNQNLTHLSEDVLDLFFDYTDLLEGVLLVIKRRHLELTSMKDVLTQLGDIYHQIYPCMIPYSYKKASEVVPKLTELREEIQNRNLLPTLDEYDQELSETIASMNDNERKNLARNFTIRY